MVKQANNQHEKGAHTLTRRGYSSWRGRPHATCFGRCQMVPQASRTSKCLVAQRTLIPHPHVDHSHMVSQVWFVRPGCLAMKRGCPIADTDLIQFLAVCCQTTLVLCFSLTHWEKKKNIPMSSRVSLLMHCKEESAVCTVEHFFIDTVWHFPRIQLSSVCVFTKYYYLSSD